MLLAITRSASLRAAPFLTRTPMVQAAVARFPMVHRFKSAMPFAVDGPDGDHDYQEMVCTSVVYKYMSLLVKKRYTRYAFCCCSCLSSHLSSYSYPFLTQ